jgi:capsular exopolysaccharide synthesis family protein
MNIERYGKTAQNSQPYEAEEGGLNINALTDIIWRRLPIITAITAIISFLAFLQASNRTPTYQAGFEILSEPVTIETKVSSSGSQSRETTEEITAVKLNEVQIKTLKSPEIINSVVKQLKNQYPQLDYALIASTLDVITTNEDETILAVTYKHPDAQLVKNVLEVLATTYLDYSLQRRQTGVRRGLEFLDLQIPRLQTKVDQLNLQLQQIREKHNFIEPKIQAQQLSTRLESLVKKQLDNKSQLDRAKWNANLVEKELEQEPVTATTAAQLGTNRYDRLLGDLKEIDREIAKKSSVFTNNSEELKSLVEEKAAIIALIEREGAVVEQKIDNQISSFEEENRTIDRDISNLKQEIKGWSGVTQEYEEIQRQITITVKQLNELLIQREVLKIESAQKEAPWRLLTSVGEPQTDSASSTVNYVVLGTLLGLLGGVGVAIVVDKYQNRVYTLAEVQEITNLPILSIIPFDRALKKSLFGQKITKLLRPGRDLTDSSIQLYDRSSSPSNLLTSSTEPFQFFLANLGIFEAKNTLKSLIVTSAIPGEGKSTIAFNLAKTAASMGKRVLLIDSDLKSTTKISLSIPLTKKIGLTDLILNPELNLQEVLQQYDLEEDLSILAYGSEPNISEPSKLLVSSKMTEIIETAKQNFDLVIYDAPCVVGYADVSLLATKTDGVILVTELGKLQQVLLKEAINRLNISNSPVLGVIVNQVAV